MYSLKNVNVSNIVANNPNRSNISTAFTKRTNKQSPKDRSNISTAFTKRTKNQSPKVISSNIKYEHDTSTRDEQNKPYLFSLLDIDIKTLSKGTSLPKQYLRPTSHALFKSTGNPLSSHQYYERINKLNKDAKNDIEDFQIGEVNNIETDKNENVEENENVHESLQENKNKSLEDKKLVISKTAKYINVDNETRDCFYQSPSQQQQFKKNSSYADIRQRPTSHYVPTVKEFQTIVKNSHNPKNLLKQKLHLHEVKLKSNESDIFFIKPVAKPTAAIELLQTDRLSKPTKKDFNDSDIFCIKNNYMSMLKLGEISLKKQSKKKFCGTTESDSAWGPNITHKNLFNHQSTPYHLLNPGIKNICPTRQEIEKETSNATYKAKGLFEYSDLTRVSAPNPNKKFKEVLQVWGPNVFHKNTNLCGNFRDLHAQYRDLCDKPFFKKDL